MTQRRSLVEGISATDASREQITAFVYDSKPEAKDSKVARANSQPILPQFQGRVPLTTRVTPEIASALKRASLTRQLNGQEPFYVQEIMEEAIIAWLSQHGSQA